MTPPPQRLKCIHRMVCFRHNGEGADKEWGTDAGCIPDCNQYVILASHTPRSEREKVLDEFEEYLPNLERSYMGEQVDTYIYTKELKDALKLFRTSKQEKQG